MIEDLTMLATLPVDESAVKRAQAEDEQADQPVVPPDDPHRQDVDREPCIDPPPIEPPMRLPSEKPGITEPPRPRA